MSDADAPQPPPPQVLPYQTATDLPRGPRPAWVYAVVTVYLLLLLGLIAVPFCYLYADSDPSDVAICSAIAAALLLSGVSLMIIPVHAVRHRPVKRRTIWLPVIGSALFAAVLFFGAVLALLELASEHSVDVGACLLATGGVWLCWMLFFGLVSEAETYALGQRLYRLLIAGSVLELLIAVPAHLVVRRRHDCCAGIYTAMGIAIGVGVMFLSLGPAVFLLYHRRRVKISHKTLPT